MNRTIRTTIPTALYGLTCGLAFSWLTPQAVAAMSAPVLLGPANGASGISLKAQLNWTGVSGATLYRYEVREVGGSTITGTAKATNVTVVVKENDSYTWRVRGATASVNGPWSKTFEFTTRPPLGAPILVSPADQAQNTGRRVVLNWQPVPGATSHDVQVLQGSRIVVSKSGSSGATVSLSSDGSYQWRVRGKTSLRTGPWSELRSFQTASPLVNYTAFNGNQLRLRPWLGKEVAILTSSANLDPAVMAKVTDACDAMYQYYAAITGRTPSESTATTLQGRETVAQVPSACGAACAYVGSTGIELQNDTFTAVYEQVRQHAAFDQVLAFELGLNFCFYGDQLEYHGDDQKGVVTAGFAVFHRFTAMESAHLSGAPFRGVSFDEFRSDVEKLADTYEADPSLTWENTLAVDHAPQNTLGLGGADLFASFLFRLWYQQGGDEYLMRLWTEVAARPAATSTQEALDNFVVAASVAASSDLSSLFADTWRWPVSDDARAAIQSRLSTPE